MSSVSGFRVEPVVAGRLHDLRRRVLRNGDANQSVDHPLDQNEATVHFAGLLGDRIVVSSSFYLVSSPVNPEVTAYQLRYMATDYDVQSRGYGALVLEHAEEFLRLHGAMQLWANARDTALNFYKARGWLVVPGSEHVSNETQLAHTVIYKNLVRMS